MVCVVGAGREVGRQAGSSEELLEAQPPPFVCRSGEHKGFDRPELSLGFVGSG